MKTNFEIEDNYAVKLNGIHIDLHNNFEFSRIHESDNNFIIEFKKSKGNWVHENEFSNLSFIHKKNHFKDSENGDNSEFPEDENTLSFITFFSKNERNINNSFMTNKKPNINDDIIYFFENGKLFRINCDEIELIAKK